MKNTVFFKKPKCNVSKLIRNNICVILCLSFLLCLSACSNSPKKQQAIIELFESFDNSDSFILHTSDYICIGDDRIATNSIQYNGQYCYIFACEPEYAYAYSFEPASDTEVNIVCFEYDSQTVTLVESITTPSRIIHAEYYKDSIYFRMDDPTTEEFRQIYYIYDPASGECDTVTTDSLSVDIEKSADQNRSFLYTIEYDNDTFDLPFHGNKLKITNKETGEVKSLSNSLLDTCPEGKQILDLGELNIGGFSSAYEKDGIIYAQNYYCTDGSIGYPCHYFIMKYDFKSNTLEYYTSLFFEEYPDGPYDLYIP